MSRALAAWFLIAAATASPATAPRDVVQSAVVRVVAVLEDPSLNRTETTHAARPNNDRARSEIRRVANDLFDFQEMARRALSRHWATRTPAEQAEFVKLFTELLERSYVGKIEAYSGEKIVYLGETVDGSYATVKSRILTKRRTDVTLDYRLHLIKDRWKVYDVLIDGVSAVNTYRSEFNRVIQSASYDELMDRLRKKTLEIRTAGEQRS